MTAPNLKVKVVRKAQIKLKVMPRFPSSVTAESPLLLNKSGGSYDFSLDVDALTDSLDPLYEPIRHTFIYADDYDVLPNGSDMGAAFLAAIAAADGAGTLLLDAGTYKTSSTIYLNKWTATSALTVPGLKIKGQGKGVTFIDTSVANGYAIAVNPAWWAAHKSLYGITAGTTGGSLATNTYYVQITVTDDLGNEIYVTAPKSIAVTGATGKITVALQALLPSTYKYNIYVSTSATPANYATVSGSDAKLLAGNQTVIITAVGGAHAVPTTKIAVWQEAEISDLTIISSANATGASGVLYFKAGYASLTNVRIYGLAGDGLAVPNFAGDRDGGFDIGVYNCKFDTIAGWGINAAGAALELSSLYVDELTEFNLCGTAPTNLNVAKTITSITNGVAPVVSATAHNFLARDQIAFSVTGMTLSSTWYRVGETVTANSFTLVDLNGVAVDTTSLGAFASGTVSLSWRPPQWDATAGNSTMSGGIAWLGLIGTIKANFTQCQNVSIYASENGSSDNLDISQADIENTAGKGAYIASATGGSWKGGEILSASALGATISGVQLGTGFPGGGVSQFTISGIKVRSDVTPAVGFEQFQNTNVGSTYADTNIVERITWQTFDAAGQKRFDGFKFRGIAGQAKFSISSTNTAQLIPIGTGSVMPIKLKATGEWVEYHVPVGGVRFNVGAATALTTYYFYLSNSAATGFPVVGLIDYSAGGDVLDSEGYNVRFDDTTRLFLGTATTDGSGNFLTTGAQFSQYPAGGGIGVSSATAGQIAYYSTATTVNGTPTGTGVLTALGINVGSAGAPVLFNGAGGTPSSLVGTNISGTAANLTAGHANDLPSGSTLSGSLLSTNIAAPSSPAAGKVSTFTDSTDLRFHDKNSAGTIGTTAVAKALVANQYFTSMGADGTFTSAAVPTMTATVGGLVPTPPNNTTTFLRGDGSFSAVVGADVALTSAHIFVGNGSNVAADVALSGDATISNTGAIAIGATKITSAMLNADVFSTAHSWGGIQTLATPVINGLPTGTGVATANSSNTLVARDASGNFGCGTVTAANNFSGPGTSLTGTAAGLTAGNVTTNANSTGDVTSVGNATTFTGKVGGALGQIPGTTTNDNASAGNVGEYIQSFSRAGSGTVTFTNATPTVVTHTGHGMTAAVNNNSAVSFTTSVALPTGITAGTSGTTYFVSVIDANTYHIASTVANCIAGTFVAASSTGTGTQTASYRTGALTSTVIIDAGGISLTAGDWDVSGTLNWAIGAATTVQLIFASVGTSSATFPASGSQDASFNFGSPGVTMGAIGGFTMSTPVVRFSLSSTTTIFLDAYSQFATSTMDGAIGFIRARRVR